MADIDYDSFKTVDEVQNELEKRKNALHRLVKHEASLREDKKASTGGYNDQIKETKAKIEETTGIIDGLNAVRKQLEK